MERTRAASSVNQIHNTVTSNQRYSRRIERWPNYLPCDHTEIEFSWRNWFMSASSRGELSDTGNTLTILSAVAECNDVVVELTFEGTHTRVIADGENDVRCQKLTPSQFGLTVFAAGTTIWTKVVLDLGSKGARVPTSPRDVRDVVGGQSGFFEPSETTVQNATGLGAFSWSGASPEIRPAGHSPWCLGKPVNNTPSWLALGDSITSNFGDGEKLRDGRGWFQRASSMLRAPNINMAVAGSTSLAGKDDARFAYWYEFATHGVIYYGNNDFSTNSDGQEPSFASLVVARIAARRERMKADGLQKVGIVRLGVTAQSSDSYTTETNQIPNWRPGSGVDVFNQSNFAALGFDFVIPNDANRGRTDRFKWFADDATPQLRAQDVAHPSSGGAQALAEEAITIMQSV